MERSSGEKSVDELDACLAFAFASVASMPLPSSYSSTAWAPIVADVNNYPCQSICWCVYMRGGASVTSYFLFSFCVDVD